MSESGVLLSSPRFQAAKAALLEAIKESGQKLRGVRDPSSERVRAEYLKSISEFNRDRGRDLYFPFLSSGLGSGPWVELMDGSVKLDMITGIGVNFFGHSHPALIGEMIDALPSDIMQGNLQPGHEARELVHDLVLQVGPGSRLKHAWLMCSGTMVNEIALKLIRQKHSPSTQILAFKDCFAGRSTAMQEITDNPKYREGQPVYGEVFHLPFYDPATGARSTEKTLEAMREHLAKNQGKVAGLMMEIIQGEGGFRYGPREFYVSVLEEAKRAGLAIWFDEIQTFGRTGELFAYQKFDLASYADLVTIGKMLQACAVLYTTEYNPKPGLVAGTFAGSTVALRTARKTLSLLSEGGFLGPNGRIERLSSRFKDHLKNLSSGSCKGILSEIRAIGGMIGFVPFGGTLEDAKAVLMKLFDLGMVAFYCGHGPVLIRLLPPLGVMQESDVDLACQFIEKAMLQVAQERQAKSQ